MCAYLKLTKCWLCFRGALQTAERRSTRDTTASIRQPFQRLYSCTIPKSTEASSSFSRRQYKAFKPFKSSSTFRLRRKKKKRDNQLHTFSPHKSHPHLIFLVPFVYFSLVQCVIPCITVSAIHTKLTASLWHTLLLFLKESDVWYENKLGLGCGYMEVAQSCGCFWLPIRHLGNLVSV